MLLISSVCLFAVGCSRSLVGQFSSKSVGGQ